MNKEDLAKKIRLCTSAIEMLNMKEAILEHLEGTKKKKKEDDE